jgi:hypothetical protein
LPPSRGAATRATSFAVDLAGEVNTQSAAECVLDVSSSQRPAVSVALCVSVRECIAQSFVNFYWKL